MGSVSVFWRCHPEEAESHAKRATPDEGSMQFARSAADLELEVGSNFDFDSEFKA
jgi:hypothetical protein